MPNKPVIVIKSHRIDAHLFRHLDDLRRRAPCAVKLLHHSPHGLDADPADLIPFSSERLKRFGITTFERTDWAWHMADGPLYEVFEQPEQYDFALMLEYDVKINFDIAAFLEKTVGSVDYAALYAGFSNPQWLWTAAAARWFENPRGSFFPLVAVSRRLAEAARAKRAELSAAWIADGGRAERVPDHMVHCEAFLPSLCADLGWAMRDLAGLVPGWDSAVFTTHALLPWEDRSLDAKPALHPCFPMATLPAYLGRMTASPFVAQTMKDRLRLEMDDLVRRGMIAP